MIPTLPIQGAIYAALTSPPGPYPVYNAVPQESAPLPYIVIGEWTAAPDDDLAVKSADLSVMIHAWSKHNGAMEAHQMLDFVRDRLDYADLGAGTWACWEAFAEVMEDRDSTADRRRFHGAARYRIRAN